MSARSQKLFVEASSFNRQSERLAIIARYTRSDYYHLIDNCMAVVKGSQTRTMPSVEVELLLLLRAEVMTMTGRDALL